MQYYWLSWPIDRFPKPECQNGIGGHFSPQSSVVVDIDSIDEDRKSLNNEEFDESSIDSGLQFKKGRHGYDLNIQ